MERTILELDPVAAAAEIVRLNEQTRALKRMVISQQQHEARRRLNANKDVRAAAITINTQQRDKLLQLSQSVRVEHQTKHFVKRQREEQAKIIENRVKAHLNHLVLQITEMQSSDISLIQRRYSMRVDHTIRAAVQSAWQIGIDYVGGVKKRSHEMFITSSEVDQIKKLTADYSQVFWRRVAVVLHSKDTITNTIKSARFSPRSSLTLSSLVTSLAVKIVTKSIAMATLYKVNVLKTATGLQQDSNTKSAAGADGSADPSSVETLQWVTQHDEKVCPFCAALDGTQWASDDPSLLTPPDDSHDNCRCRLDIVDTQSFADTGVAFG